MWDELGEDEAARQMDSWGLLPLERMSAQCLHPGMIIRSVAVPAVQHVTSVKRAD
jgi:hypothetical protein